MYVVLSEGVIQYLGNKEKASEVFQSKPNCIINEVNDIETLSLMLNAHKSLYSQNKATFFESKSSSNSSTATSNDSTSNDSTSNDSTSNDSTSNDSTSNDSTSNDSTSNDSTSNDSTSNDSTSNEPLEKLSDACCKIFEKLEQNFNADNTNTKEFIENITKNGKNMVAEVNSLGIKGMNVVGEKFIALGEILKNSEDNKY